jgi:hypothetical protein
MMHGADRELFIHKNSNTIYLQGAHRAVFSLLTPWSTGLFGTATAICLERLHPELKKNIAPSSCQNKTTRVCFGESCETDCALVVGPHGWDLGLLSCQTLLFRRVTV